MDQPLTALDHAPLPSARRPLTRALGVVGALALAGVLAACGGDGASTTDDSKPKPSVTSDDSGGTTIEGPDGSITVDEDDGTVVIEGEDGSATFSGGTELPDGWPAAVPVVDGTVVYAQTSTLDGATTFSASVETTDSVPDLYSTVRDALVDAGLEAITETTAADGAFAMFTGGGWDVLVTVGESESGAAVVYAVTPAS